MRQIPWFFLLCLLDVTGCTMIKRPPPQPTVQPSPVDFYERADGQSLLQYAETLAHSTPTQRHEECRSLLEREKLKGGIGVQLHLFLAQVLLSDCGDISKTTEGIKVRRAEIKDEGVRGLFDFTEQVLGRLKHETDQRKGLERQLRATNQRVQSTSRQMKTRESEIKSLQDKIDALKSIEQDLGGSQDGN